MKMMKWLYGWLLVALYGFVLFFMIWPHIVATLWISRLRCDSDSKRRIRLGRLHRFWGIATWYFMRILMRMNVEIDIDAQATLGGPFIVIANHRTALDHVMVYVAARAAGITDLRWVLKKEMRKAPVIGWLNAMMGSAFLTRSGDHNDVPQLNRMSQFAEEDHASVIIYPEGTRFRGTPEAGARFRHVREPKMKGYAALATSLPTHRTLCVTIGWGRLHGGRTFTQVSEFLGRRVRLRIHDMGLIDHDQAGHALNTCWVGHEFYLEDHP